MDFRIVGVTCSIVLPQTIIENVSSNITSNSCYRNTIEKSHLFVGKSLKGYGAIKDNNHRQKCVIFM